MATTHDEAPNDGAHRADLAYWHQHGYERAVAVARDFAAMVRTLSPDQLDRSVPGSAWTVSDVVAHVDSVCRRYTVNPERAADREQVAAHNAADLERIDQPADELASDIVDQLESLREVIALVDPAQRFPFHAGQAITMAGGWGNAIGELLAHGDDIARAAGVEWVVDAADLEPLWRCTTEVLGGWLSEAGRSADELWALDLGFASGPVLLELRGGEVHPDPVTSRPVDRVVAGDAVEVTLTVPYRRRSPSSPELLELAQRFESI